MADGSEDLRIVVRAVDEASATLAKVSAKVEALEKSTKGMGDEQRKAMDKAKASAFGLSDAFGMIIKKSPYVLGADILARVAGFKNLADLTNKTLQATSEALDSVIGRMTGYTASMKEATAGLDGMRGTLAEIRKQEAASKGIVDVGFGLPLKMPPGFEKDILRMQEVIQLRQKLIDLQFKEVERLSVGRGGEGTMVRTKVQRDEIEATQMRIDLVTQLQGEYDAWSRMIAGSTQAEADYAATLKKSAAAQKEVTAAFRERQAAGLGKMIVPNGPAQDFAIAGIAKMSAQLDAMIDVALTKGPAAGASIQSFFTSAAQGADGAWPSLQKVASALGAVTEISDREKAGFVDAMNRMRELGDPFADRFSGETTDQKLAAIDELLGKQDELNRSTREQAGLWTEIGIGMKQGAGWVISNMLFDLQNGRDILEGMLRNLLSIGNQVAGQWLGNQLFPSAMGNVFSGGNVVPFARGGVIGGPSTFPMSDGRTGLMGEAGPEAIVPLAKTRGGKLGIESTGGGRAVSVSLSFVSLDPSRAADVIMQSDVWDAITSRLTAAISTGENMALRTAVAGAR